MKQVLQNESVRITLVLVDASTGDELTGVDPSEITLYYRKAGLTTTTQKTVDSTVFREVDAANMPGLYELEFTASELDTVGEFIAVIQSATSTNGTIDQIQIKFDVVTADEAELKTLLNEIQGTGFDTNTHSLEDIKNAVDQTQADVGNVESTVVGMDALVKRILGLSQENFRITGHQYDGNNNLIGSTVKLYGSKSDAETDVNPIAEYSMTAAYDANNRLVDYRMVKEA